MGLGKYSFICLFGVLVFKMEEQRHAARRLPRQEVCVATSPWNIRCCYCAALLRLLRQPQWRGAKQITLVWSFECTAKIIPFPTSSVLFPNITIKLIRYTDIAIRNHSNSSHIPVCSDSKRISDSCSLNLPTVTQSRSGRMSMKSLLRWVLG